MHLCNVNSTKRTGDKNERGFMGHQIVHQGTVASITGDSMQVRITQRAACSQCSVSAHCHIAEQKEKMVDVNHVKDISRFGVGETVILTFAEQTGMRAVMLAFVVPFLIVVAAVFGCSLFTDSEPLMAMTGILFLIPYYIILYLLRDRLKAKFTFRVEKLMNN